MRIAVVVVNGWGRCYRTYARAWRVQWLLLASQSYSPFFSRDEKFLTKLQVRWQGLLRKVFEIGYVAPQVSVVFVPLLKTRRFFQSRVKLCACDCFPAYAWLICVYCVPRHSRTCMPTSGMHLGLFRNLLFFSFLFVTLPTSPCQFFHSFRFPHFRSALYVSGIFFPFHTFLSPPHPPPLLLHPTPHPPSSSEEVLVQDFPVRR